jgi:putative membrane protein
MQKNKTLKGLLAVSAVAAMFGAVGVQAQNAVSQTPSQTGTSSAGKQNTSGKTTREGTIDDHGQALSKVQALAQARGVTLPTELDAKHKAMSAKLEKLSGDAFDKAYMANAGVKDHKDTKSKLASDAKKIKDADVKALADQHMPVVEQHLKSAEQMHMAKPGTAAGK